MSATSWQVGYGTGEDWRRELLHAIASTRNFGDAFSLRAYEIACALDLSFDRTLPEFAQGISTVSFYTLRDRVEICVRPNMQRPAFVIAIPYGKAPSYCYDWKYTDAPWREPVALASGDAHMAPALDVWRGRREFPEWWEGPR